MPLQTWSGLQKSSTDDETIEQAIARLIGDHNADPTAHRGAGESLDIHKTADVIDHPPYSVLNDKLELQSRAYTAIVDIGGHGDVTTIQAGIDLANANGGGNVLVRKGFYNITSDIFLGKYVNLLGEGIKETILDFGLSTHRIYSYTPVGLNTIDMSPATWTNGSKIVIFFSGAGLLSNPFIYVGMIVYDDYLGDPWIVQSIDSDTQIHITANYTGPTGSYSTWFAFNATFTNGSPVVTFPSGANITLWGLFAGINIDSGDFSFGPYQILSIDSPTQLTLRQNFADTTGSHEIQFYEDTPTNSIVRDFSLQNSHAPYLFDGSGGGVGIDMDHISFANCYGIATLSNSNGYLGKIYSVQLSNCANTILFDLTNYEIAYAQGFFNSNNNTLFRMYHSMNVTPIVRDSYFSFGAHTGNKIFRYYFSDVALRNCTFVQFNQFVDFTGTSTTRWDYNDIRGNSFTSQGSGYFDLPLGYSTICENSFGLTGGTAWRLPTVSLKNICTSNFSTGAIVDSGTSNVVANNRVY